MRLQLRLHLEDVSIAGNDFVEDRVDEDAEEQAGEQSGDDDDGERLLRVAADAGGHGGRKKTEASDESGRHNGAEAQQGSAECGFADGFAFKAKLVDVADEDNGGFHGDAEESEQAKDAGDAPGRVSELEGDERADRLGHHYAEGDGDGEFEIAVKGKKNHEDEKKRQRANDDELRFGFEKLAIFAAPIEGVTFGEFDGFGDGGLTGVDDAFEVAAFHGELNADVAGIVFTVDEGSAGAFADGGELGERNLLSGGGGHENIGNFAGAGTILRLHAHDEIKKFFALNDLGGGLAADGGLHDGFDVGNVDAVTRDFLTIGFDEQAGLAEFANDGEFGKAFGLGEDVFDLHGFFLEDLKIRAENLDGEGALEAGESFVDGVFGGLRVVEDDAGGGFEFFLEVGDELFLGMDGALLPSAVVVRLQADVKLAVEEAGGIGAIVVAAELGADDGDLRILREQSADFGGKLAGFLERDGVRHGGANPQSAFIEVGKKFAADERDEKQSGGEDQGAEEQGHFGMIEAPSEACGIGIADPIEDAIVFFLNAFLEPVGGEDGNNGKSENQRADERKGHGVRHGVEKFAGGASESVDGKVTGDDDGDGIENGAVDVAGGGENHFVELVSLSMTEAELAVNVLDHDDGAVNDDAEVDGADGEKVGGFTGGVKKDEGEEQGERDGKSGDDGGADADQEKDEHDEDEDHAANEVPFDGIGGHADQVAAVVERADFHVRGKNVAIEVCGFLLNGLQNRLRLFAAAHEDDAFDGVIVFLGAGLKTENAEAGRVADFDVADVLDADGNAIVAADDDFADVFGGFEKAEAADVIKLAALRIEAAAGVGIVGGESGEHLHNGKVIAVEARGVEQDLILHGGAAEAGIVRDARDAAIRASNDPIVVGLQFLRRTIGAFEDVAIHEGAGTEKRRHAGHDAGGKGGVADALEDELAREVRIDTFIEGEAQIGKPIERDGRHTVKIRVAVHAHPEREGGKALDFFSGVARPLGNELDHRRRKIGISVHGHALKGNGAGNDDEHSHHEHEEALLESELDDAMDHGDFSAASPVSAAKNS